MNQRRRSDISEEFREQGFVVGRDQISEESISALSEAYRDLCERLVGSSVADVHTGEMAELLATRPDVEARAYDGVRALPVLTDFVRQHGVVEGVRSVVRGDVRLLRKIVLRSDLPRDVSEYAHWHQDHYYVRGDLRTITAWIPLQDTDYELGCLSVMPGSHELGLLDHDVVIGKRHVPRAALGLPSILVPMRAGDVLLFHSCLVHASGINWSDRVRYSVQARYIPMDGTSDPGMGGILDVG